MAKPNFHKLAVPIVCLTIAFLAYTPQYLFYYIEPGPLTRKESILLNVLVCTTWWTYERACRVDPGKLPSRFDRESEDGSSIQNGGQGEKAKPKPAQRWCRKCKAVKPPRSHHCKQCGRCIPKMDHHCPWTSNCVSHTTFPHFIRFVVWACVSLATSDYFLVNRAYFLYEQRNLPSYLGPSVYALGLLTALLVITNMLFFVLIILAVTSIHSLVLNITMIERWEIERHEALVDRARRNGGYVYGPGGRRIHIKKQEFPYDIGIWENLVQGTGTTNVLAWFLPFGGGPTSESGWEFETNGFEDPGTEWPPIDPDKLPRVPGGIRSSGQAVLFGEPDKEIEAFKKRQEADYERWQAPSGQAIRQREIKRSHDLNQTNDEDYEVNDDDESDYVEEGIDGEPGWTSSDGTRLRDFGVDEEADFVEIEDEDDIPLGELIRRRKAAAGRKSE